MMRTQVRRDSHTSTPGAVTQGIPQRKESVDASPKCSDKAITTSTIGNAMLLAGVDGTVVYVLGTLMLTMCRLYDLAVKTFKE